MRLLLTTGIFPPDIGGPATHTSDLRAELVRLGHDVTVLTLTDEPRRIEADGVVRLPRAWPWPLRLLAGLAWIVRHGRRFDAVYATGLGPIAVTGATLVRRPVVLKIVGDPAWERSARRGLTDAAFDDFQAAEADGAAVRAMRWLRNWTARRATVVVTPSRHLAAAVEGWRGRADVVVVPNGARARPSRHDADDSTLDVVFIGRLVAVKRVELVLEALASVPAARLRVVGDGPELAALKGLALQLGVDDRVTFLGAQDHEEAMDILAGSDVLVLASSHEGLPHVVLEALACGVPVVATRVGGLEETLTDGVDSLLVGEGTPAAFAAAFDRLVSDRATLDHLRHGARRTGEEWRMDTVAARIDGLLRSLVESKPRAVFVARSRFPVPPRDDDRRKFALHDGYLETILVCPSAKVGRTRLPGATVIGLPAERRRGVGSALFYATAPVMALALSAGRPRTAIICQSPYEGFGVIALRRLLPRSMRPAVQVELHGDWTTATRLYGSAQRRRLSGAADRVAEWSLRRADRVRPVSESLGEMARRAGYRGPVDRFVAFSDYRTFEDTPLAPVPASPHALFVGVLERYKAVDVLLDAWPRVTAAIPAATLTMVGAGSLDSEVRALVEGNGLAASVRVLEPMPRSQLRELIDGSVCLVLPSRSEGLPRIALEAMARGRAVVATPVGGLPELIDDGRNGRLVALEDASELADALVSVLSDPEVAAELGAAARQRAVERDPLREYEAGIARMARWIDSL